jgi:hypothetical protein
MACAGQHHIATVATMVLPDEKRPFIVAPILRNEAEMKASTGTEEHGSQVG